MFPKDQPFFHVFFDVLTVLSFWGAFLGGYVLQQSDMEDIAIHHCDGSDFFSTPFQGHGIELDLIDYS